MYVNSNIREVTIGRAKTSDIYLDANCIYASSHHATIYMDGDQLMFKDTSTNGSMINNVSVRHRAVPINQGDIIMLAGQYQINWNQINHFFPPASAGMQPVPVKHETIITTDPVQQDMPATDKWSWGAAQFSWIWGVCNGCWWIALIQVAIVVLSFIPFVNILTSIVQLAVFIACGIKGRQWAWENKSWNSVSDFNHTQSEWDKWGFIFFIASIVISIICLIFYGAFMLEYLTEYY